MKAGRQWQQKEYGASQNLIIKYVQRHGCSGCARGVGLSICAGDAQTNPGCESQSLRNWHYKPCIGSRCRNMTLIGQGGRRVATVEPGSSVIQTTVVYGRRVVENVNPVYLPGAILDDGMIVRCARLQYEGGETAGRCRDQIRLRGEGACIGDHETVRTDCDEHRRAR